MRQQGDEKQRGKKPHATHRVSPWLSDAPPDQGGAAQRKARRTKTVTILDEIEDG